MEGQTPRVNNAFYDDLGEAWYDEGSHPIALLRAENAVRNPWIIERMRSLRGPSLDILDIGCGAGFLSNALAKEGHRVTGIDLSEKSLHVAKAKDTSQSVQYLQLDASSLPFHPQSFDVICAMDFLEHIENPKQIVQKVAGLLKPGGLFFFHTFNRNPLSWLVVIKGVEWCVPNTPENMHIYSYFIKPSELESWCEESGLGIREMRGLCPRIGSKAFWSSLLKRRVSEDFTFKFSSSLATGYVGIAQKNYQTNS